MSSKHFLSSGLVVLLLGTVSASILELALGSTGKNYCKLTSNPCAKGRLCVNVIRGYMCVCATGFIGTNCQIKNACDPNPCVQGACHVLSLLGLFPTYVCTCNTGYTGKTCNKNKGKHDTSSEEDTGTYDPVKSTGKDKCKTNPCVHGACSNGDYGTQCTCEKGWIGENCDTVDNCVSNPCINGGVCIDEVDAFTCSCADGWTGAACETRDYCCSHPCVNNGTCVNGQSGYTCSCATGWSGTNCDTRNFCDPNPCVNGACANGQSQYTCSCSAGWTGANCNAADPCVPNPCVHGICTAGSSGFSCQCETDWSGSICSEPLTYGDM